MTQKKKNITKPKKKISNRLSKKEIDNRAETLNPTSPKYYKSRIEGITDDQAKKIAELKNK